jgi:hypothetical protein
MLPRANPAAARPPGRTSIHCQPRLRSTSRAAVRPAQAVMSTTPASASTVDVAKYSPSIVGATTGCRRTDRSFPTIRARENGRGDQPAERRADDGDVGFLGNAPAGAR